MFSVFKCSTLEPVMTSEQDAEDQGFFGQSDTFTVMYRKMTEGALYSMSCDLKDKLFMDSVGELQVRSSKHIARSSELSACQVLWMTTTSSDACFCLARVLHRPELRALAALAAIGGTHFAS